MSVVSNAAADGFIRRLPNGGSLLPGPRRGRGTCARTSQDHRTEPHRRRRGPYAARASGGRGGRARARRPCGRSLCNPDVRRGARDLDRRAGARPPAGARASVCSAADGLHNRRQGGTAQEGDCLAGRLRRVVDRRLHRVLFRRSQRSGVPDRCGGPCGGAFDRAGRARRARRAPRGRPPNDARRNRQIDALCARKVAHHGRGRRSDRLGRRPFSSRRPHRSRPARRSGGGRGVSDAILP